MKYDGDFYVRVKTSKMCKDYDRYKEFVDQNSNNIDLISWIEWCENNGHNGWWIILSVFWPFSLCILIIFYIIELFRKMLCWIRKKNGINE
jgi:hypothetical protein